MELKEVGKEIPMKVVMAVKSGNKRLFLFERTDKEPSNSDKAMNTMLLKDFMKEHRNG